MTVQRFAYSTLRENDIDPAELSFQTVPVTGLGPPVPDPAESERWGEPSLDERGFFAQLVRVLQATLGEVAYVVTLRLDAETPAKTFVYHDDDVISAVQFVDDEGNYEQWLAALAGSFGDVAVEFGFNASQSGRGPAIHAGLLATDPASLILKAAPSTWVGRSELDEKQAVIAGARAAAGPPIHSNPDEIRTAWTELVQLAGIETAPGATVEELASFHEATGFDLPEGLATLLSLSNGASEGFGFRSLMSVEKITSCWLDWKGIFDDFMLDDLQHSYKSDADRTVPLYTNPRWISFVDESTGNYAAVDLLPGPAGRQGQIIYFGADEYTIRWLAEDITDFLNRQIAHIRGGGATDSSWF